MKSVDSTEGQDRELLTHEETIQLIHEAQNGDKSAMEVLVLKNIALVKSIVKKFLNRGYEYEDLMQIGTIGLMKSIYNYDYKYNVRFSTYAVPMIMGEIKRFVRDDGMIKVSRSLKELAGKAMYAKEKLKFLYNREPTIQEIADEIGSTPEEIIQAMEAGRPVGSIYDVIYEDDDNPILMIDKIASQENHVSTVIDKVMLKEALEQLEERERTIIIMRYFQDKTQSEIAKVLGISQVQISRIEKKVLAKLREML
ncbi:MAG TPA: RNA polymerase sporulation sigma factor SigF [Clostridiales bacterium]|nr:RNA polymerase sporulation sigma factor SigF [Clostridiales bacterium]